MDAFRKIDQTSDFPEMSRLLTEIKDYRGEGIAAKLFMRVKSQKLFQWWWNIRRNILINQPISSLNRI